MTGTTTSNVEGPELKLGQKSKKRKKTKMAKKVDITKDIIKIVSEDLEGLLDVSVLKLNGALTVEALKEKVGSLVDQASAELVKEAKEGEELIEAEVNWEEVLTAVSENNKYSEMFEKFKVVLEKIEGVEEDTVNETVGLFASALNFTAKSIIENYDDQLTEAIDSEVAEKTAQIEETVEAKYKEALTEWVESKKELIQKGKETQLAEKVLSTLKALFVEHEVSTDDETQEVVNKLTNENKELKDELEELKEGLKTLKESIEVSDKESIINSVSEGVTEVEKEKIKKLAEGVIYVDAEQFEKKLTELKEAFLQKGETKSLNEEESKEVEKDDKPEAVNFDTYLKYIK